MSKEVVHVAYYTDDINGDVEGICTYYSDFTFVEIMDSLESNTVGEWTVKGNRVYYRNHNKDSSKGSLIVDEFSNEIIDSIIDQQLLKE